jgi:hypothetical protein
VKLPEHDGRGVGCGGQSAGSAPRCQGNRRCQTRGCALRLRRDTRTLFRRHVVAARAGDAARQGMPRDATDPAFMGPTVVVAPHCMSRPPSQKTRRSPRYRSLTKPATGLAPRG